MNRRKGKQCLSRKPCQTKGVVVVDFYRMIRICESISLQARHGWDRGFLWRAYIGFEKTRLSAIGNLQLGTGQANSAFRCSENLSPRSDIRPRKSICKMPCRQSQEAGLYLLAPNAFA